MQVTRKRILQGTTDDPESMNQDSGFIFMMVVHTIIIAAMVAADHPTNVHDTVKPVYNDHQ